MELKFKTVFPGWNDEPILQTALKGLRRMYILAGRGRCDFPIRLKLIFLRVQNQWTACWVWLMDALVFYFTSIVFLNAWILMSLDKAFTSRFPTALLAPCYLTSRQIHTFMLTAWSLQAFEIMILNHRIFAYFLICFVLIRCSAGPKEW